MTRLLHVVPGPAHHGVTRHGLGLQEHLGPGSETDAELLRCGRLDELADGALAGRVVAVQMTDRLVAGDAEAALSTWRRVTAGVARLTVVLHDLPQRSDGRSRRARSRLYAALAASADEVVVASRHERLLLTAVLRWKRPAQSEAILGRTQVIPLPIERLPAGVAGGTVPDQHHSLRGRSGDGEGEDVLTVATLGFVYPGKGLEEVIDAAALAARDPRLGGRRIAVRNLGRASDGHEDLVEELTVRAEAAGISWSTSGWVDDADLPGLLAATTVPVAAHRHVSASGSVATWLAGGRRPLVLASRYSEELASRLPGALTLVDLLDLAGAIADALVDPGPTYLAEGSVLGPSWAQAAAELHEVATRAAVSVVIPYYRDQRLLDLILAHLRAQVGVAGGVEVVVADDGSPQPPDVGSGPDVDLGAVRSVRVVRQGRDGFRAAAARNLGARHTHGRVLCFLDGDTIPEDGYLAALQRVCLEAPTLALGRRRHADLAAATSLPPLPEHQLPEPAWLTDGYRDTEDLRAADDGSFRFVISAVLGLTRQVWDVVGGFEEALTGYGGEDWELGWRCWLAGADLRHVPEAVAWHDGPDLAGRAGADPGRVAAVKNAETARLAPLLPHPLVRGRGWTHPQPDVVAVVRAQGWTEGQVMVVVESLLRLGDVGVWVGRPTLPGGLTDPRVHAGAPDPVTRARARAVIEVTRPVAVARVPWSAYPFDLTGTLGSGSLLVEDDGSGVRVVAARHAGRHHLQDEPLPPAWLPQDWVEPVPPDVLLERWRQRWS